MPEFDARSQPRPSDQEWLPWLKRFGSGFLFLAVPLFLAFFGNQILFLEIEDTSRGEAETRLEEALSRIESERNPQEFFSRFFQRFEKKLFEGADPKDFLKQGAPFLRKKFPGMIELVFLDGSGKPVQEFCDKMVSQTLLRKFYEAYKVFLSERKPLPETVKSFMKSFLGEGVPTERESHGYLTFASAGDTRMVYFSRPNPRGMLILFLKADLPLTEMALQDSVKRLNRQSKGTKLCLAWRGEGAATVLNRLGVGRGWIPSLWSGLERSKGEKVWVRDLLLGYRHLFPSLWVVGCLTFQGTGPDMLPWVGGILLLVLVLRCLSALLMKAFAGVREILFSVRFKLLAAFLYAVLVPLMIMGMTARTFLAERRTVMEQNTHEKAEKALVALDDRYMLHDVFLRSSLGTCHFAPDFSASDTFRDFMDNFRAYQARYRFDFCRVFDHAGREVFEFLQPDLPVATRESQLKILPKFVKNVMDRFSLGGVNADLKGDPILATLGAAPTPFSNVKVMVGKSKYHFISIPLGNSENQMTHIAFFSWNQKNLQEWYLRKHLVSFARSQDLGIFLSWPTGSPETVFPRDKRYFGLLNSFSDNVISSSKSFRTVSRFGGQRLLVTGLRGSRMSQFSFLVATSDLKIQAEIQDLAWKFQFVTCIILGISVIIVFILARLFIQPLGELARGMKAISNRDFSVILPVGADDELGRLAYLFNATIGDMKDLEVAKNVQESLFPRQPLMLGSWEIFGSCLPASQVGGDYFDYFLLDPDRALIIIGDVSGHGVGAALVVAMAKAIIGHPATSGNPMEILASLNTILLAILKRKKMMSCCLALLDRRSGLLTVANAGQSYPVLMGEGPPKFLELKGYPLGSAKNWKATTQAYGPLGGGLVLFYTDGLIEALDRRGNQIGYDRFLAVLPSLAGNSAVETEKSVRAWHASLAGSGLPDDDISLVVVQEKLSPEPEPA